MNQKWLEIPLKEGVKSERGLCAPASAASIVNLQSVQELNEAHSSHHSLKALWSRFVLFSCLLVSSSHDCMPQEANDKEQMLEDHNVDSLSRTGWEVY